MKHTTTYHTAERWVKNAASTAYKHMTYENAMKALMLASVLPVIGSAASAVRAGVAAGSVAQVASGVAQGLGAAGAVAPSVVPAAQTASGVANLASGVSNSMAREQAARRAQGPMSAQAYLNRYDIPVANRAYGTESQYQTARARINR